MIKAFIFDFDGTLVNTEPVFNEIWAQIAKRFNRAYTPKIQQEIMGFKALQAVAHVLDSWGLTIKAEDILAEIDPLFIELVQQKVLAIQGGEQLFDLLDQNNITKAIATSSQKHWVDTIFSKFDWHDKFAQVITAEDVQNSKPHPEPFLKAMQNLGVQPYECVIIEDSIHGLSSALASGAITIALNNHLLTGKLPKANFLINSLEQIDQNFLELLHSYLR